MPSGWRAFVADGFVRFLFAAGRWDFGSLSIIQVYDDRRPASIDLFGLDCDYRINSRRAARRNGCRGKTEPDEEDGGDRCGSTFIEAIFHLIDCSVVL